MKQFGLIMVALVSLLSLISCDTSEQDFKNTIAIGTSKAYDDFIIKHPKSDLVEDSRDSIVAINCRIDDLLVIADNTFDVMDYEAARRIREVIEQRSNSKYQVAAATNTIEAWNDFLNAVPSEFHSDAKSRLEDLYWQSETFAWKKATENDDIEAYKKYMEHHPYGKHAKQAEKKLIDLEVASVFAGEHGSMPAMDKGYSTGSSYSVIEIGNNTEYELTISYSGPDSKRMVIPANGTKSMRIGNGTYHVAASVGHGVIPFAGVEHLDGSHFSSSFYISTSGF